MSAFDDELLAAAEASSLEAVKAALEQGADVDARDATGRTALIWAVTGTSTPFDVRHTVLARLVENGADVNAADSNGETAMFSLVRSIDDALALRQGPQCIQILVDAGANRNPVNSAGKTPLAVVRPDNHLVIDLLRNLGFTE